MPTRTTAAVIVAAAAATAHADIVQMGFTGTGRGQKVQITMGSSQTGTFAGQLMYTVTDATGVGEQLLGENAFYCTDLFQTVSRTNLEYQITGLTEVPDAAPMNASQAGAIRDIFAYANEEQFSSETSNAFAAAFQLSVWEIVSDYDSTLGRESLDIDSGWFQASGWRNASLGSDVLGYMGDLFDAVGTDIAYGGSVLAFQSEFAQDQLRSVPGRAIPTPGSTASLALGLLVTVGRRRRG